MLDSAKLKKKKEIPKKKEGDKEILPNYPAIYEAKKKIAKINDFAKK